MGGGNLLPQILANSDAVPDGVDLSQCYVIKADPTYIDVVEYSTSTQTSRAQWYNIDATHRVYYVPQSEQPKWFTVRSNSTEIFSEKKGISNITTESGKALAYGPRGARFQTSNANVKPGDPIVITVDDMDKIRTGVITVTLLDAADNVYLYNCCANYSIRSYTKSDFKNGTLTIKYDPNSENTWFVKHKNSSSNTSSALAGAMLNGKKLSRSLIVYDTNSGVYHYNAYGISLSKSKLQHTLQIMENPLPGDIPVTFYVEQTTGNETEQDKLLEVIESLTVGSTKYTAKEWLKEGFTVPNGSKITLGTRRQVYGSFEIENIFWNGEKSSSLAYTVEAFGPEDAQTVGIRALVRNPWRFTLNFTDREHTNLYWSTPSYSQPQILTSSTYQGEVNVGFYVTGTPGYKVYEVEVNGKKVPVENDGYYRPTAMNEVISVTPKAYTRDIPITVVCGSEYNSPYIYLDYFGQNKQGIKIEPGANQVMVHQEDLPFRITDSDALVFLNDVQLTEKDENGDFSGLKDIKANDVVSIYYSMPTSVEVTHALASGYTADIYHNGKKLTGVGKYSILQGSQIVYEPKQTNMVVESSAGEFFSPSSDGKIYITAKSSTTYTLHPKNDEFTIICNEDWKGVTLRNYPYATKLTGATTKLKLPYGTSTSNPYSFEILGTTSYLESVTATGGNKISYNTSTKVLSGIVPNCTVTLNMGSNTSEFNYYIFCQQPNGVEVDNNSGEPSNYLLDNEGNRYMVPNLYVLKTSSSGDDTRIIFNNEKVMSPENSWSVLKKTSFPVKINASSMAGYFTEYGSTDPEYGYMLPAVDGRFKGNTLVIINGKEYHVTEDNYKTFSFSQDTPGDVFVQIVPEGDRTFMGSVSPVHNWNYHCSVNGVEFDFDDPNTPNPSKNFYAGSVIEVWDDNGSELSCELLTDLSWGYDITDSQDIEYNAETGRTRIYVPVNQYSSSYYQDLYLKVYPPQIEVTAKAIDKDSGYEVSGIYMASPGASEEDWKECSSSYWRELNEGDLHYVFENPNGYDLTGDMRRPVAIRDTKSNKYLDFDPATGAVHGLQDGMRLEIECVPYNKWNDEKYLFTYINQGSSTTGGFLIKAGSPVESELEIVSGGMGSAFYDWNLPFKVTLRYGDAYPVIYVGTNEITRDADGNYNFPTSIPNYSSMRVFKSASDAVMYPVTVKTDSGIEYDVLVDECAIGTNSEIRAFDGSQVTVKVDPDCPWQYEVYANGKKLTKGNSGYHADGYTFMATAGTNTVEIRKVIYNVTFNMDAAGDMNNLSISGSDGEMYYPDNSGVVTVEPTVETMTLIYSDPDRYISAATVSPNTMKYDVNTGVLSNIVTGTVNLTTKVLERNQQVDMFIDGADLEGAELVMANGKVISNSRYLNPGSQTIAFSADELPIIFKVPDSYFKEDGSIADPAKFPVVYVNGEVLTYSAEHKGFILPEDAFTGGSAPVIKIYSATPEPTAVSFIVEPGITFTATAEKETLSEPGTMNLLPGTMLSVTATATDSNEEIYIEANNIEVTSGATVSYSMMTGESEQTIAIKRRKVAVTVMNDDAWRNVRVVGAGYTYPMYDAQSELEFPRGTTELTLRSTSDSQYVVEVQNATSGASMTFNPVTGVVSGVADGMKLSLVMGDMIRDRELTVYFEESENTPKTSLVVAEGKAIEKEITLQGGYQAMMFANSDLPLAVKSAEPLSIYLNNALISYNSADAAYDFPAELPENPVVKVYTKEQPEVKVKYESEAGGYFDMVVTHDRVNVIDHTAAEGHIALPGTEIRFTVEYNEAGKQLLAARKAAGKQVSETTEVSVNGTVLEPDEDGAYSYKVSADHAATGLSFLVKRPDFIDEESGYVLSFDRKTLISVNTDKEGNFTVPDGVTTIGEGAFKGCDKLTTVVIPKSVTEVEENAFSGNTNLKQVVYPEELEEELGSQIDGLDLPTPPVKVGYTTDEVSIDENGVITGRNIDSETGNYVEGKTLVYVPDEAIDENGTYKIPNDITEIGKGAFEGNENLKNIEIPETVTSIGNGAFSGCKNLTDVDLTEGLKEIGEGAFTGSGITDINVPNSVKEIGEGAFKNCENLEKVVIGGGVDSIDPDVFEGSDNIKEAIYPDDLKDTLSEKLPDGIKQVPYTADEIEVDEETGVITGKSTKGEGEDAKESKSLVFVPDEAIDENGTYKIPDDIDEIDNGAFTGNEKLTNLEIPETVTSIGNGAFTGCKNLEELDIPDTVTDLGDGVLEGCENISKVTIPDGVESIGPDEFKGCTNLKEVTLPETVTEIGEGAFEGCSNLETINIPETVTEIGENAFKGCEKLTEVTLPDNIESIGKGAFEGCSNLTDVNIPDNVKEIGEGAFKGCESLTTIAIPPTVDNIGDGAFEGCTNLDKFVYPDKFKDQIGEGVGISYPADEAKVDENGVIYTPDAVYFVPSDAKAATIPETATMIAPKAFKNCTEIENVTVPNQVDEIAAETFSGCSSLKTITLGSSIASIGAEAFKGCSSLHEINIHSNVKNIGANAFDGCDLTQIHIGAGITTIGDDAFAGNNNIDEIAITAQTPPALGSNAFGGNTTAKLFVQGASAVTAYGKAAGWNVFTPQVMVEATSVNSTDKTSYEMNRGDNVQLNASVLPSDAKLGAIFWEVSDPSMATVSNTGLVTLIEPTTASRKAAGDKTLTVTARTMYANGPTHTVTIKDVTTGVDMVFEDGEASSIEELLSKGAIYTLGGLKVNADTKSLEPGIYIIKIDGKTRKITVK